MSRVSRDEKTLQEFRDIMEVPTHFEDGFSGKTVVGAIFLGLFMLPGSMYLQLFMGASMGPAARWVTVILFAEVAKRSLKSLKQQEIFILFYMTGIALGSPFSGLLWNQYLVQSDVARGMGITPDIPTWVAPSAAVIKEKGNTFLTIEWLPAILLVGFQLLITRINGFGLGYALYRLTAHGEKLPFPMAPVAAQGVLALVDDKDPKGRWRWTAFAIGGVMGLLFGFIYVGIPSLTGTILGTPYQLLPIPWFDLTQVTEDILPATPINIIFDLTAVIVGMVLPFWAVIGGFGGLLVTIVANPILYRHGVLTSWRPGMGVVDTLYNNNIDFYLPITIGLTFAVFAISIGTALRPLISSWIFGRKGDARDTFARGRDALVSAFTRNRLRGDIPILISILIYLGSTATYILLCCYLIRGFPWIFFTAFALLYTPLISYATAKLEGLVGQTVSIPLVRDAAFILSGYQGAAIWFAPIPQVDYAGQTQAFRVVELTGTKMTSLIKTELITVPVVIVSGFLFSQFLWRLGPIPSEQFPFAQQVWRLYALNDCLRYTATMEGGSKFIEALNPTYIAAGLGLGVGSFVFMMLAGLPTFLVFGFIRGLGQMTPGQAIPEFLGAILGRVYFRRKFGEKNWRQVIPVVLAGFTCGIGLMAMAAVGVALIAKSISALAY